MKAWRNPENQRRFRNQLAADALKQGPAHYHRAIDLITGKARVGRAMRDQHTRILPGPSPLLQALMLRAGVWPVVQDDGADLAPSDAYIETEAGPVTKESLRSRFKNWLFGYTVTGRSTSPAPNFEELPR